LRGAARIVEIETNIAAANKILFIVCVLGETDSGH
jgi:hypothetical protein